MITIVLGAITGFLTSRLLDETKFAAGGVLPVGSEVVISQGENRPLMKGKVVEYDDGFYFVNLGTEKAPKTVFIDERRILN